MKEHLWRFVVNIGRFESTIILMTLVISATVLGYFGKVNAENILFTIAGGVIGASMPAQVRKDS